MRRSALFLAVLAAGACSDDLNPNHTPGTLTVTGGNAQTVVTGANAAQPFAVTLVNKDGSPMAGITISWAVVPTIGGTMANNATVTDVNGVAKATFEAILPPGISGVTAGNPVAAGTVTVNALASGLTAVPLTITVTK
ncbi:MAG TPA: hypothetical protein VGM82_04955 [Gemmatimonadaceae bacterium]